MLFTGVPPAEGESCVPQEDHPDPQLVQGKVHYEFHHQLNHERNLKVDRTPSEHYKKNVMKIGSLVVELFQLKERGESSS